jgi:hypothetical protein
MVPAELSETLGSGHDAVPAAEAGSVVATMSAGQVRRGDSMSETVTTNRQISELPEASVEVT